MTPRVCITIPFYANLGYLEAALRSLVAQTDDDWSAIVIDDASPEPGARQLVAELGDDRVRYMCNDRNLGIAANFNLCLELGRAAAEMVAIFHADDLLEPGFVAAIRSAHCAFPAAACVATRVTVIDADGRPTRTLADSVKRVLWPRRLPFVLAGDRGLARVMHGQFFYCPAVSYRVELLPPLHFDGRWRQVMDLDLFARLLLGGGSIALVPERAYRFRRHDASESALNWRSFVRATEETEVIGEIVGAARRQQWPRTVRAGRLRLTVRLNEWLARRR
ncbi:MAG: glycosyltransferase [Ilumatobacteraceae bacterium]